MPPQSEKPETSAPTPKKKKPIFKIVLVVLICIALVLLAAFFVITRSTDKETVSTAKVAEKTGEALFIYQKTEGNKSELSLVDSGNNQVVQTIEVSGGEEATTAKMLMNYKNESLLFNKTSINTNQCDHAGCEGQNVRTELFALDNDGKQIPVDENNLFSNNTSNFYRGNFYSPKDLFWLSCSNQITTDFRCKIVGYDILSKSSKVLLRFGEDSVINGQKNTWGYLETRSFSDDRQHMNLVACPDYATFDSGNLSTLCRVLRYSAVKQDIDYVSKLLPETEYTLKVSPEARNLTYSVVDESSETIHVLDSKTGEDKSFPESRKWQIDYNFDPVWSPDNTKAAFLFRTFDDQRMNKISYLDLTTMQIHDIEEINNNEIVGSPTGLTSFGYKPSFMKWQDDATLLYTRITEVNKENSGDSAIRKGFSYDISEKSLSPIENDYGTLIGLAR